MNNPKFTSDESVYFKNSKIKPRNKKQNKTKNGRHQILTDLEN